MRILYFHQHFSSPRGATGTRSYEMARHLVARGHNVTMVCGSCNVADTGLDGAFNRGRRDGDVDGIRVVELELPYANSDSFLRRSWVFMLFALRSVGIALFEKADLVFATSTPLTAGIPGIAARWLRGVPFVFEVRDLWPELPRAMGVITNPIILKAMGILEWCTYHSAHAVIGLAPGIVEGIVARGVPASRTFLIPNGCDLGLFAPDGDKEERPPVVAEDDLMLLYAGTHGQANGLDALLDAARLCKEKGYDRAKFVFVGTGALKPHLVARARDERLSNCVFLDPVPKSQLASFMRSADVGLMILKNVSAFYYGTSPNKFFDYLAAGLPVVCNYPGWVSEMIEDRNCGLTIPPEKAEALSETVQSLVGNHALLSHMGDRSRALAMERFDRQTLAVHFSDLLEMIGNQ